LEILVNSEKLDFTLESEKSLGEVIAAVEVWLRQSNLVIASIQLALRSGGEAVDLVNSDIEESWSSTPVEDIERLSITARLLEELQFSNIQTVTTYLNMLKSAVEKGDRPGLDDLLPVQEETFKSLNIIFASNMKPVSFQETVDLESLLAGAAAQTIMEWPEEVRAKALSTLDFLIEILSKLLDELSQPLAVLTTSIEELENTWAELKEASVLLQTGQEQRAMLTIVSFADLSQKILRIISRLEKSSDISIKGMQIGGDSAGGFFADFNRILRELLEAFDTKDTVLIGDLLEYEVAPRLELFLGFLREVKKSQRETP
jgi:hypothetical protein